MSWFKVSKTVDQSIKIAPTDSPLSKPLFVVLTFLQRMLRVAILVKTRNETRKVRFKVCTDLIENNALIDFLNM